MIFIREGGDQARLWSVVEHHGEVANNRILGRFVSEDGGRASVDGDGVDPWGRDRRRTDSRGVDAAVDDPVAIDRSGVASGRIEDVRAAEGILVVLTEEQKACRAAKRQLTNALKEGEQALRHEARPREWHEQDLYLTREQALAGEACRGCGLPVIDNLASWPAAMYLSPEERVGYDAAEALSRQMHPKCDAHRWSMQGSRATHCGYCCPPISMSQKQARTSGACSPASASPARKNSTSGSAP